MQETKPSVEEMNEVIALFDGYTVYDEGKTRCVVNDAKLGFPVQDLRYHDSWNWLMPVVEKINSIKIAHGFNFIIYPQACSIHLNGTHEKWKDLALHVNHTPSKKLIESVFQMSYDFITWYNNHINSNKQS